VRYDKEDFQKDICEMVRVELQVHINAVIHYPSICERNEVKVNQL